MGIFDQTSLSGEEARSFFSDALAITIYSYHNLDHGLANGYNHAGFNWGLPKTLFTAIFGNNESQGVIPGLPWNPDSEAEAAKSLNDAGWFVISADELNYTGKTDARGTYFGEKKGYHTAQAEVLGKYDDAGNLIQIGIAFRGTSGPRESLITDTVGDILNDLAAAFFPAEYSENYTLNAFGNLLDKVADYAAQHGLKGTDVVVSGHSLGGLAVNSLASLSDSQFGGFYSDSHYIAFASPTQYEIDNRVLNTGFENDPVFRALEGTNFNFSSLFVHDGNYINTTDNIVNFNDYYASCIWNVLPQSLLNLASWISHMPFFYQDSMSRILNSEFYSLTEQDSTIIVANLSDATRGDTWIEDLNRYAEKHTGPTFIIGSDNDDLIRGSCGTSYLEGGKGDDTFQTGGGNNIIIGGEGNDTLDLQTSLRNYQIAWDGEGLFIKDQGGSFTLASGIEKIQCTEKFLWIFNNQKTFLVGDDGLNDGDSFINYASSVNGDSLDNNLSAEEGDWLFGLDGNDTLIGAGNNIFVGGKGDDELVGHGTDNTYLFSGDFSHDTLYNFTNADKMVFLGVPNAVSKNYLDYVLQKENDLVLDFGENSVTLVGVNLDSLTSDQVILA